MEALGAGANVAALVIAAAQLSKFLYTTFCSIKDGPDVVRKVTSHMQQLYGVLEQLKLSPLAAHDDALVGHIALCIKDLNQLADGVTRLQSFPGEKRTGKLWKRFRCFLDEKKLDDIHDQLIQQINTLGLRHSVLQSNAICKTLSNTNLATQSIEALDGKITQQTQRYTSELSVIDQNIQGLIGSQTNMLQNNLSSIHASIESVSSVSHSNTKAMLNVLDEIKNLVTVHVARESNRQEQKISRTTDDHDSLDRVKGTPQNIQEELGLNHDLLSTIVQLSDLVRLKNCTFDTDEENDPEAEDIIENLQTLLNLARKYGHANQQTRRETPTVLRSNIRRFNQAFGQVQLAVNAEGLQKNGDGMIITQKHSYAKIHIEDFGSLSLRFAERTRALPRVVKDPKYRNTTYFDHVMTATFMPYDPKKFNMIVASTLERSGWAAATLTISRLDVNRILPANSPVFKVVQEDRLEEFRAMLQNGEASLRDHDEFGANLLMYSTTAPEVCKYLLSANTLDLDHIASDRGVTGSTLMPSSTANALAFQFVRSYNSRYTLSPCQKLLLEAGADPSVEVNGNTLLKKIASRGDYQSIKSIWDCYLKDHTSNRRSAATELLFEACSATNSLCFGQERFSTILKLGADISARDAWGCTCLHLCVLNVDPFFDPVRPYMKIISLLLENGADPYARDNEGVSVSELVYDNKYTWPGKEKGGSMLEDIWDRALHDSGHDIALFRQNYPRQVNYTSYYTAKEFRDLWYDREDECPYPDPDWLNDEKVKEKLEMKVVIASPDVMMNRKILPLRRKRAPAKICS